jgi:hypothetical protein
MHPRHPLPTIAQRPAQPQFERQAQARQKPPSLASTSPVRTSTTRMPKAWARWRSPPRRCTTGWRNLRHRRRRLGQLALATVTVPTHRRAGNQHLGRCSRPSARPATAR